MAQAPAPVKASRKPRRKADIPENETPAQRFRRVASARVVKAVAALETLSGCFDTRSYEWTMEQADKVVKALENAGAKLHKKAMNPSAGIGAQDKFDL